MCPRKSNLNRLRGMVVMEIGLPVLVDNNSSKIRERTHTVPPEREVRKNTVYAQCKHFCCIFCVIGITNIPIFIDPLAFNVGLLYNSVTDFIRYNSFETCLDIL